MSGIASKLRRLGLGLVCTAVLGCGDPAGGYQRHQGPTMGTSYRVTASCPVRIGPTINAELERVNAQMSTYDAASTLSQFNGSAPGGWFAVGSELVEVVLAAETLFQESAGAFDVTVGPLVNLWGFGPVGPSARAPTDAEIATALEFVGDDYLEQRSDPPALRKGRALYVDLSAIAKGYGVDRLARQLDRAYCEHYLVEVGGEVRVKGVNESGQPWRIGVEVPDPATLGMVQRVVQPGDNGLATSGDYRNFLEVDGERFSHTIDPRSGRPVTHNLASVTVVHESAMWADGYATLLNVLGPRAGFVFAEERNLAALFVERTDRGFEERYTPAMKSLLGND